MTVERYGAYTAVNFGKITHQYGIKKQQQHVCMG